MKLIIDIDEDIRAAITRMGLLRIPDEMQKKVDKAIQHGTPLNRIREEIEQHIDKEKLSFGSQFDSGLNFALKIIDKYKAEKEG